MRYIIDHTNLSFWIPELIALIFMLGAIFVVWKNLRKLKKRHEELEEMVEALGTADDVKEEAKEVLEKISVDLGEEQNQ